MLKTRVNENMWRNKDAEPFDISHPHRKLLIDKISKLKPFNSVLEIGCGSASNLYLLSKNFSNIDLIGIDINEQSIRKGKDLIRKEGVANIKLLNRKADIISKYSDKSIDIIFTDAVLLYIGPDKIDNLIKEMKRIARKGIILLEWHNLGRDEYDLHIGVWKRDYFKLLKRYFPVENISMYKIKKEDWPDKNWQKYGYLIKIKI